MVKAVKTINGNAVRAMKAAEYSAWVGQIAREVADEIAREFGIERAGVAELAALRAQRKLIECLKIQDCMSQTDFS